VRESEGVQQGNPRGSAWNGKKHGAAVAIREEQICNTDRFAVVPSLCVPTDKRERFRVSIYTAVNVRNLIYQVVWTAVLE
jgi:hypothetical protein